MALAAAMAECDDGGVRLWCWHVVEHRATIVPPGWRGTRNPPHRPNPSLANRSDSFPIGCKSSWGWENSLNKIVNCSCLVTEGGISG